MKVDGTNPPSINPLSVSSQVFRQLLERRSDKFADARVLLSSRPSQRRSDVTRNSHRKLRVRDTWRIEFCEIKTSQRDTDDFARRA